jgi:hypothetical protein
MNTLYQCGTCGTIYKKEQQSLLCETLNPLPPCPVKIGDTIEIKTRYNGIVKDVVQEILVQSCLWTENLIKGLTEQTGDELEKYKKNCGHFHSHEYGLKVKNEWQLGKDYYSNIVTDCNCEYGRNFKNYREKH